MTLLSEPVVNRLWDWMRREFRVDWRSTTKTQFNKMVSERMSEMQKVAKTQRQKEKLERFVGFRENVLEKTDLWEHVQRRAEKLPKAKETRQPAYTRKGKAVRGSTRILYSWQPEHAEYVQRFRHVRTSELATSLNHRYGTNYSYASVANKKSRLGK